MDQLQTYVYCVYLYCPVSAMYLYLTSYVSISSDQDAETASALRPRHGRLLRPPAHSRQEVRQHPRGESQHHHNVTFILEFLNSTLPCVQKQGAAGGAGPPYPMWHLEPLYVRKVTPGPSKRSVAKVQEQRSVFSSRDGEQHSLQQQMEQGQQTAAACSTQSCAHPAY